MFRAVVDGTHDATWTQDEGAEDVLLGLAHTFRELAAGIDAFGQLVHDEAGPSTTMSSADVERLREALDGLHEARARLEDLLVAGLPAPLLELHAALLSTVKRLLREMDLDERVRRQVRLLRRTRPRLPRPGLPRQATEPPDISEPTPESETQLLPLPPRDRRDKPPR
jgi:hypothetical protein